MAKTPTKDVKKVKKDKSAKKKKRKTDDKATKPKKKRVKLNKDGTPKKLKKKKTKKTKDDAETPKETPKKKKKKKVKTKDSTGKKKGKKGKSAKKKKGKKVVKEEEVAVKEEEEAAPAVEEKKAEEEKAAAPVPAAAADDGATIKLFVGNLSFDLEDANIREFFKDCGTLTDIFWLEDKESGRFLGKGFVTFETVDQARKGFAKKDEELLGRPIMIDYARPREKKAGGQREARPLSEKPEGCTTVFVGNLNFEIDDDAMKAFAKECGEIKSVRWLTDRDSGDFKGCGFCEFTTSEGVDEFIKLNGQSLMGRPIRIDYAKARSNNGGGGKREPKPMSEKPEGCTTVFVGNVSFEIEDKQIHDLAKDCGDGVKNIRWLTDRETQEFKGCGFVEFYDTESLDKFILNNGKEVLGRSIRIDYAKPRAPREF